MEKLNKILETEHYIFSYIEDSLAAKDIHKIATEQENSFQEICQTLKVIPDFKIHYYLLNTPEEVGEAYGDNEPCSGFARMPNQIYAVYNDKIKCIGPHEDAHIISYIINRPSPVFIREGLAMYFDKTWWGKANEIWVKEFIKDNKYIKIESLLNEEEFYKYSDAITYPIAGAFTHFLIDKLTIDNYLNLYRNDNFSITSLKAILNTNDIDAMFIAWIETL